MLRDPDIVYREFNQFHAWVWAILLGVAALSVLGAIKSGAPAVALALSLPLAFWALVGRLTVEVRRDSLRLQFGRWPLITRVIPFEDIEHVEAVTYRPLREFGGWGVRGWGRKKAWTTQGNEAVRLDLWNDARFYVGSQTPQRLEERLRTAIDAYMATLEDDGAEVSND